MLAWFYGIGWEGKKKILCPLGPVGMDMVANMKVDKVADMKVNKVANMKRLPWIYRKLRNISVGKISILLLGEPSKIPFPIPCVFDQSSLLADLSRTLGLVTTLPRKDAACAITTTFTALTVTKVVQLVVSQESFGESPFTSTTTRGYRQWSAVCWRQSKGRNSFDEENIHPHLKLSQKRLHISLHCSVSHDPFYIYTSKYVPMHLGGQRPGKQGAL